MGCGTSSPKVDVWNTGPADNGSKGTSARPPPAKPARRKRPPPDDMLATAGFEYLMPLGKGGTGVTGLFEDNATGQEVAIKLISRPLPKPSMPNILREITIQAELGEGHVNIIEAKEIILTDRHLCLVMEYAAGNSLTGYVADKWQHAQQTGLYLSEDEARFYFRQFLTAVAYCHEHSVAHRDLKLDNTLLDGKTPGRVKLCDFGFAKQWVSDKNMFTHIGTPVYMSPEQLDKGAAGQGYLGTAVDVWAAGVLLIVMLLGQFPYDHIENPDPNCKEAHSEVFQQQTRGRWSDVPHIKKLCTKLSPEVKDLLDKILVPSETERVTIPEIEAHPWYRQPLPEEYREAEQALAEDQRKVDQYVQSRQISPAAKAARDKQLKDIVEAAGERPPPGGGTITRIDLREAAVVQNPATVAGLHDLAEE
mmetsp:Transcript_11499/g.34542  ORF Transcript_11499/g.34542 Transcript_11499/m.34542 type:complete len:421 (+) Transcript_11499:87-1349(+)